MLACSGHHPWTDNAYWEGYQTQSPINSDKNRPVVILIHVNKQHNGEEERPFLEHNYLRYFRKIYESKGWTTLQCTPSGDVTTNEEECSRAVQSVLACLETRGLHQCPLFLHLLGPRAVPVYNEFTKAVTMESGDLFQIYGSIIDSAPCRPSGIGASLRKTFPTVFNIYIALLNILATIFPEFFSPPVDFDSYETFCYNRNACPQLYLYSECDHIVSPEDVESVVNIRYGAGVPVEKRCWPDSDHARHLFTHELEYTSLCQDFVQRLAPPSS